MEKLIANLGDECMIGFLKECMNITVPTKDLVHHNSLAFYCHSASSIVLSLSSVSFPTPFTTTRLRPNRHFDSVVRFVTRQYQTFESLYLRAHIPQPTIQSRLLLGDRNDDSLCGAKYWR